MRISMDFLKLDQLTIVYPRTSELSPRREYRGHAALGILKPPLIAPISTKPPYSGKAR